MRPRTQRFAPFLDRFVPSQYQDEDPETLRRARLTVFFAALLLQQALTFTVVYLCLGLYRTSALVLVAGALIFLTPWQMRRSIMAGVHHLLTTLVLILVAVSIDTGGPQAPAFWWLPAAPVMATMLAGRRAGWFWLGVVTAVAAVMTGVTLAGHVWPQPLSGASTAALAFLALASLGLVHFGLAALYEDTRERMMEVVDHANREMRLVLDNVEQGFVTVDAEGKLSPQRSRALSRWFRDPDHDATFWQWIGGDSTFARWLRLSWDALFDGVLPVELAAEQIPSRFTVDGRALHLACRPLIDADGGVRRALMVITDVTAQAEAERAELAQREMIAVIERASRDRAGFLQFWSEASALVKSLDVDSASLMRTIHTLKGNCGLFGVRRVAEQCHALESRVADTGDRPTRDDLRVISDAWHEFSSRVQAITRTQDTHLEVTFDDYETMMEALLGGADTTDLIAMLASWRLERTSISLGRFAEQARALALRLHRGELEVVVDDGAVRLDRDHWAPFWSAFVHAVRNAVDHGIETPAEREAAGKTDAPTLRMTTRIVDDAVIVELADNGRGIDWDAVSARAAARGLPHGDPDALHEALFLDGITTRAEATEHSGRGVGLAALREACRALGGSVHVRSERHVGTTLAVTIPLPRPMAGVRITASYSGPRSSRSGVTESTPANDIVPLRRRVTGY